MADTAALRTTLYDEITARIEQTDLSVPYRRGGYWYYDRTVEGLSYPIACRIPVRGETDENPPNPVERAAEEQILFDENLEAEGHEFFSVGALSVSPSGQWLAFSTDVVGDERFELRFRDLSTGTHAPEVIGDTYYDLVWANDDATVLFTRVDDAMRPYQLWRHTVGTPASEDHLVFEEPDQRFNLTVTRSKDGQAIVLTSVSSTSTECWIIDPAHPTLPAQLVEARRPDIEYAVDHHTSERGERHLVKLSNEGAVDFEVSVRRLPDGPWRVLVPHRLGTRIEEVDCFERFLCVAERIDAERSLRVLPLADTQGALEGAFERSFLVEAPSHPATTWEAENAYFGATSLRFGQTSLSTPTAVSDLFIERGERVLRKQQVIRGGYDEARYATERIWVTGRDGASIPVSLVWRPDLAGPSVGPRPCLLYGYGSYEISIDPSFSSLRLSLLDRGVIYAIAHVRGGGELGRRWYEQGKLDLKQHSFDDFIDVARHLIDDGWTTPEVLAARGGSAGGLLMGAVANQAPELFCAMVAEVPFVDCVTTMLDPSLPLTVGEYEEWGNPSADPATMATMLAYSPYDNVRSDVTYPKLFVTCGLNDSRVGYWEPAKWVAKLRAARPDNVVVFHSELGAGHGGPSGRYDAWRDEALVYSFLLDAFGLTETLPS